jgi:hypothetical protein
MPGLGPPLTVTIRHMTRFRSLVAVAAAALVASIAPVVTAAPADAANPTFTLVSPRGLDGQGQALGYGSAQNGRVTWVSNRRATVTASVTDWCPGDSRGAYLLARATFADGSVSPNANLFLFADVNGCNRDTREPTYTHSVNNPRNKVIRRVQVALCYGPTQPTSWGSCGRYTPNFVNPK